MIFRGDVLQSTSDHCIIRVISVPIQVGEVTIYHSFNGVQLTTEQAGGNLVQGGSDGGEFEQGNACLPNSIDHC